MDRTLTTFIAMTVAAICLLPLLGVVAAAALGTSDTLAQLAQTVLWRYTWTTLVLVALVAAGSIVIGIPEDPLAPWNQGRFELSVDEAGAAQARRVTGEADLTVPVKALASMFTGAQSARRLHTWGMLKGNPRAIALADAMFATRHAPHSPDHF